MGIEKLEILGNDYIGAWVTATDKFFLMGNDVSSGEERTIRENLGVEGVRAVISNSTFVGVYAAANSKGILLPHNTEERELSAIRQALPGVRVEMLHTDFNALRNNILTNDKLAIINPSYGKAEEKEIAETLDVEVVRTAIGGFSTVGANNILTNSGMVVNNRADDDEKEEIDKLAGMKSEQSTANLGSVSIGLCAVANSRGLVVGETTTGFELARMAGALGL